MRSQLDGQIDKEHPIQTARQGPTQEKQPDTQQPQANGFGTRADGCHHAPEGGKDQGDAAITGMSLQAQVRAKRTNSRG